MASGSDDDATLRADDALRAAGYAQLRRVSRQRAEDAQLAVQYGADGIIVSNHGGRAAETLRPMIDCLPEVVQTVSGRIPVFVDDGVRHGADIYKALASGARGVGIGQEGVERVLEILRAELTLTMKQMGTPAVKDITAARVLRG